MGFLEARFRDSEFEWNLDPVARTAGMLPFVGGSESESESDWSGADTGSETPSAASKLLSVGFVALAVAGAVAFDKLRSRRARKAGEAGGDSGGRRLSLSRSR